MLALGIPFLISMFRKMKLTPTEKQMLGGVVVHIALLAICLTTLWSLTKMQSSGGLKAAVNELWNGNTNSASIQTEDPPYKAGEYSFPVTNCTFVGEKCGFISSNIAGTILLGKELEATNSWVFMARLKSGRIISFPMPTNDPVDYGWTSR